MNFNYFKKLVNSLPDTISEVSIIDNGNGHSYCFDIESDGKIIVKDEERDLYFTLSFNS